MKKFLMFALVLSFVAMGLVQVAQADCQDQKGDGSFSALSDIVPSVPGNLKIVKTTVVRGATH